MKTVRGKLSSRPAPSRQPGRARAAAAQTRELTDLRTRVADADATLRAIRSGEVDTVTVAGKHGPQVFTLHGAEHAYRMLIESMNEGALTLTADKTILYANQCFARMVKFPLEQVMGSSFRRFLSNEDRTKLRPLMKGKGAGGSKLQVLLNAGDGSQLPVQISIRPLARSELNEATVAMVLSDMTEARRSEEMLRALSHRVVQVQETERGRVAVDLHDHITQLLCAILFRCQALVVELSASGGPSMREAMKLREMLGQTAEEVERISRNLRPGVLDQLGLDAVLRATSSEFTDRTGVPVKFSNVQLTARLPGDTELALYRILQEALKNVEQHAGAKHVTVHLTMQGNTAVFTIKDDGTAFDPNHRPAKRKKKGGLGLLGMSERAAYVGGTFTIKSARRTGTEIEVRIPVPPDPIATN